MTVRRLFVASYNAFPATYKSFRDRQPECLSLSTILFYHVATKISRGNLIASYHVHSFALIQRAVSVVVSSPSFSLSLSSLAITLGKLSDKLNRCVHVHRRDAINSVHRVLDWSNELHHLRFATHRRRQRQHSCTMTRRCVDKWYFFLLTIEIRLTHWSVQQFSDANMEKIPFISITLYFIYQ